MSILIKGMEMPVTCCHCPLMGYDPDIEWVDVGRETQGAYICVLTHKLIDNTKREEHCPLVPVPPHGIIDREQILDSIRLELAQANAVNDMEDYDSWMRVFDCVRKFPTIIPAEEVYGQYTDTAGNFHWYGTHSGEHTIKAEGGE